MVNVVPFQTKLAIVGKRTDCIIKQVNVVPNISIVEHRAHTIEVVVKVNMESVNPLMEMKHDFNFSNV